MAEVSTAEILQDRLTEYGLIRILARQDISSDLVRRVSIEEAGQLLQRGMYPGSTHKTKKIQKSFLPRSTGEEIIQETCCEGGINVRHH